MSDNIYNKMSKIFNIDNDSKILSYNTCLSTECFDENKIYKTFLFEFCFLLKKGSIEFRNLNDIWFFKTFKSKEKEVALAIIDILINKAEKKKVENEAYLNVIIKLVNLNDYRKYTIFKYLQSIFSYYNNNFEYILFPLLYSIGFNNVFIKGLLKNDLIDLMTSFIEKIDDQDHIYYYNINEEFLLYLNKLIYYIKYNESHPEEKKDISPLYHYLCENIDNSKKPKNIDNDYPESFNYFLEVKALLFEYDTKHDIKKNTIKIQSENVKEEIRENDNNKGINGNSTKSSSDKDSNENYINVNDYENQQKEKNDTHDNLDEKKKEIKDVIKHYFRYYSKYNTINNLYSKISSTMNEAKLNKEFVEKYYKFLNQNSENKLLINKLSSTVLMLQNSNIFNIKRKLTEALSFGIIEKYKDFFSFSNDYYPSKASLRELRALILKKYNNQEGEEDIINEDLEKLFKMINDEKYKPNNDSYIDVNDKEKTGKQIKMVMDFLRFCKNYLHPYTHASKSDINYYLLPSSIFTSNLKYADYIFSLPDILKKNKDDEKAINIEKVKIDDDFKLYKDDKVININEALEILFSKKLNLLDEMDIDKIQEKKKEFQPSVKVFHKNIEPFYQIIPEDFDVNFIAKEGIESKEADFSKLLSSLDISISKIIEDKLSRDSAYDIIKNIKELIQKEKNEIDNSYSNFENSILEPDFAYLDSKVNRVYLILKFIRKQKDKIKKAEEDINEIYETYLSILITQASLYKKYLQKYFQFNVNLFDEWEKENHSKYDSKYLKYGVLLKNFRDLLTSVKMDINYSYDEKFILWAMKNNFENYLK
jgi:hypothetical protein